MYDAGIIRSLGTNAFDTGTIFSSEVFVISLINFLLSLVSTDIIILIINIKIMDFKKLLFPPYDFNIFLVASLFGICFLSGLLALILPIFKLSRKKIINLGRKEKSPLKAFQFLMNFSYPLKHLKTINVTNRIVM